MSEVFYMLNDSFINFQLIYNLKIFQLIFQLIINFKFDEASSEKLSDELVNMVSYVLIICHKNRNISKNSFVEFSLHT